MTWQMVVLSVMACVGGTVLVWLLSGIVWLVSTRDGARTPWWLVPLFALLDGKR